MKKIVKGAACAGLLTMAMVPSAVFAADRVEIDPVSFDDTRLTVSFEGAEEGDWYHLYVGDNQYESGTLTASQARRGTLSFTEKNNSFRRGAEVRFEMRQSSRGDYVYATTTVDGGRGSSSSTSSRYNDSRATDPYRMYLSSTSVRDDERRQRVDVTFDRDYIPGRDDKIRITPLDSRGRIVSTVQEVSIENSGRYAGTTNVYLSPSRDTYEFRLDVIRGSETLLSDYVSVGNNRGSSSSSQSGDTRILSVNYPSNIEAGSRVRPIRVDYKDRNGRVIDVTDRARFTFDGYALDRGYSDGTVLVRNDAGRGDTVRVTVSYDGYRTETVLTVGGNSSSVDKDAKFALDRTTGAVEKTEDVKFTVTNRDGSRASIDADRVEVVTDKVSTAGAVVVGSAGSTRDLQKGEGSIRLTATRATEADLTVRFYRSDRLVYESPVHFTFGQPTTTPVTPANNTKVTMTIGSKNFQVNNQVVATDVAPFVSNNRTWVPLRALVESFGATVYYDQTTNAITISQDNNIVVMTIGKNNYTVNGAVRSMDVAPYVTSNRTIVPVRFVAEALGYKVDVLANAQGLTSQVIYTR